MGTLEKLEAHASEIAARLKTGEKVSNADLQILATYNSLHSKKATNAGKRQNRTPKQKH
jgi:hypothetical protein